MSDTTQIIHIAALGMEERMRKTLDIVFRGPGKNRYKLVETKDAHATIIDLDGIQSDTLWNNYRHQYPHLPTIVMSVNQKKIVNTIFLRKPIQIDSLFDALSQVQHAINKSEITSSLDKKETNTQTFSQVHPNISVEEQNIRRTCGILEDINPRKEDEVAKVYYDPERYLHGLLINILNEAKEDNSAGIILSGLSEQIVLLPYINRVICCSSSHELQALSLVPLQHRLIKTVFLSKKDEQLSFYDNLAQNKKTTYSLDKFLWQISLWTAHGRLPVGTDLVKPVQLKRWPNMTRLLITPHALRIAALWKQGPHTLLDTAEILHIPQRYVFTFYTAAKTLELVMQIEPQAKKVQAVKHEKHAFLQRLFSRIINKVQEHTHKRIQHESV